MKQAESSPTSNNTQAGTLKVPDGSPPPRIRLMESDAGSLVEREIFDPEELRTYAGSDPSTWIDIQGLGDEGRLQAIGNIFGIHSLALADAVNVPQRAKTQSYPGHMVVVIRTPLSPFEAGQRIPQVCILLADAYVVTFQERYFGFFDSVRERIRTEGSLIRASGPAFLAHALVDALIDHYYPIVGQLFDELDATEEEILDDLSPELVANLLSIQRRVTALRRVARPLVEALYQLSHVESPFISSSALVYLRDVDDHAQQIGGRLDSAKDTAPTR